MIHQTTRLEIDLSPATQAERELAQRLLGPLLIPPPPSPVARFHCGRLPDDLPITGAHTERLWIDEGPLVLHRLSDQFCGLALLLPRGRTAGARLLGFCTRSRLMPTPIRPGDEVLDVMLPLAYAPALFGLPAEQLTDRFVTAEALWGRDGRRLEDHLVGCRDDLDRWTVLFRLLRTRLDRIGDPPYRRTLAAMQAIDRSGGLLTVANLVERLGSTRRTLERDFATHVGISPKRYARIARFNTCLRQIAVGTAGSDRFAAHAVAAGLYDQSHLNREFRHFLDMTPREFLAVPGIAYSIDFGVLTLAADHPRHGVGPRSIEG